jgi:hypothetical protein
VTVAELSSRKLYPVHIRVCVCVCFVTRTRDRIKITLSTVHKQAFYYESVFPRESSRSRDSALGVIELNGTKELAGSLLFDDESFEERWAALLACCLRLSVRMWRIAPSRIWETRHKIDL